MRVSRLLSGIHCSQSWMQSRAFSSLFGLHIHASCTRPPRFMYFSALGPAYCALGDERAACRRSVGWRFSPFVGNAIPLVVDSWRSAPEMDDELRELCLAALEGFVLRCPQASRGHLDVILDVVQASLSYDPNYADDMEEDEDADEEDDEDE